MKVHVSMYLRGQASFSSVKVEFAVPLIAQGPVWPLLKLNGVDVGVPVAQVMVTLPGSEAKLACGVA